MTGSRKEWERTFAIDWWGVYYCARTFLALLIKSDHGVLVNTSSVNGFWASLGPGMPNTAYATAKFAVKGFSEALIEDLRTHAPHVEVAVVMPGHVGTDIIANTRRAHRRPEAKDLSETQLRELIPTETQARLVRAGALTEHASLGDLRRLVARLETGAPRLRDPAYLTRAGTAFRDIPCAVCPARPSMLFGGWRKAHQNSSREIHDSGA